MSRKSMMVLFFLKVGFPRCLPLLSFLRYFGLFLGMVFLWGDPAWAGQRFHYNGFLGAIPVIDVYITFDLPQGDEGAYRVEMEAATIGQFAALFPYAAQAESVGVIRRGNVIPATYTSQATANQHRTSLKLEFTADGSIKNQSKWKGRLFDPLSAIVATMLGKQRRCDGRLAVYDGIARYDLVLAMDGEDVFVPPEKIGPFTFGSVEKCLGSIDVLGGADPSLENLGLLPRQFRMRRHATSVPTNLPLDYAVILGLGEITLKIVP